MNITLRVGRLARRAITVTGAAALIAGLGLVAVAPGAVANDLVVSAAAGEPCDQLGYEKIDEPSGDETFDFGTLTWDGTTLTYDINEGYTVDICLKGGTEDTSEHLDLTGTGTLERTQDISHIGYKFSLVPGTTTTTEPGTTTTTTPGTTTTTPGTTTTTPGTTTTTPGTTTTTPGTTTTTPGTTTTTPDTTTSTPGASVLPSASPSVTPSVLASAVTSTPAVQPAVLARTGIELWTVALLAGLFLLAGGAMVALGNGASSARRH